MSFQQYPFKGGIPSGNTAARPGSPVIGDTFYNGQLEILEIWNGTTWVAVSAPPSTPQITSVADASTGDAYTSTAGKIAVVFQAGSGGGTPSQYNAFTVSGGHSASSSSTTVTLTGLTPGTSYEVYGNGQNNFGTTVNTPNQAAITPTTLPEVRTIGTASSSAVTSDVIITWTNGNNGGKNLTSITITPFLNGTTAQTSQTASTTSSTSHTFTGLSTGSTYTFKVKATNANGTCADSTATNSVTVPGFVSVEYLVVGGGGAGSANFGNGNGVGGGGAGGFRTGTGKTVNSITGATVTVGAGGTGQSGTTQAASSGINTAGASGTSSVFSDITAAGGGGGGRINTAGVAGGSGGGAGNDNSGGAGNTPSTSPSQGNNGGPGSINTPYRGGGGGGAGATGGDGEVHGNGGAGSASSITGSSVTYAGGGGGGAERSLANGGAAGTGGGGAGGGLNTALNGANGTANTGGGGGGGAWPGPSTDTGGNGGNGGSGVVILRWLTSAGTINVGAGLTADATGTDGSYSYKKFTAGTGTVTFS
jgi:hypothetical protein